MQTKPLVIFSILLGISMLFSTHAEAEDLCELLKNRTLKVVANGYKGQTNPYHGLTLSKRADGTYTFRSSIAFEGEPSDRLTGTCKNGSITFKRTREGDFIQEYNGWIFERGGDLRKMAGTFAHNGVRKFSWCGELDLPQPR